MSESFFADYFSPKENLARRPFHDLNDQIETKSDDHQKESSNPQDDDPKTPEVTPPRRKKTRTKRAKRGDSLEREIAKLILGEASTMHALYGEVSATRTLSPKEILSDLQSHDDTPSISNVTKHKDANECKKSDDSCFDDTTALGHFAEDSNEILRPRELFPKASSDSDAFDFVANNNTEWAVFDDSSVFGTEPKPTKDLDEDKFPVSGEEESEKEKTECENLEDKVNHESFSLAAPSQVENDENEDEKSKREEATDAHCPESPSVISSDDKSAQSESRTGLLNVCGTEKSDDFEPKQSPSSVTNFPEKDGFVAPYRTVGQYMLKKSPAVPKLHWTPKPPAHSSFLLYQPGDTLS